MTCPYLECGYNKNAKLAKTFHSVDGNRHVIHFWKALGKYFQVQYQAWKFVDLSKIYNNKIIQTI